jgi:NADPH:quinone reductase-like Zn-dependent oxidoreductase
MLFSKSGLTKGDTVLIQGASGGVASALIPLANAAGFRVWVTTRTESKKEYALKLGAQQVFESNAKLPEKVDAVMETVGQATWAHSMRSLKPGGRIVVSGATTGANPPADLNRLFFLQLQIIGSTMGSKAELLELISFLEKTGLRPDVHKIYDFTDAKMAFENLINGDMQGKLVLTPS